MSKKIYFGLAQWHHNQWCFAKSLSQPLQQYSNVFSTVEGNTSFYGIPSEQNIKAWDRDTSQSFKFCFKFPREISHKLKLSHCSRQVSEFLNRISILNDKLGVVWLQLDQYCDAGSVSKITSFLQALPDSFDYAVEVRSLEFYKKDEIEQRFNGFLQRNNINRVMFDTRSLFALQRESASTVFDEMTLKAFSAKPRVPTHVIATAQHPFIRIIIPMQVELGLYVVEQWVVKIAQWLSDGLVPYVFFHTPDNAMAPEFAELFCTKLALLVPGLDMIVLDKTVEGNMQSDLF
jgi:uncharacterized protein YecE (DUF72 family)